MDSDKTYGPASDMVRILVFIKLGIFVAGVEIFKICCTWIEKEPFSNSINNKIFH